MTRPKKSIEQKRSKKITVALTPSEKVIVLGKAKKAGLKLPPYLVAAGLNKEITESVTPLNIKTLNTLAGVANNLNQLTKKAHSFGLDKQLFTDTLAVVNEIRNLLDNNKSADDL